MNEWAIGSRVLLAIVLVIGAGCSRTVSVTTGGGGASSAATSASGATGGGGSAATGCGSTEYASHVPTWGTLVADADHVYWGEFDTNYAMEIFSAPIGGGPATPILQTSELEFNANQLIVDGARLYFTARVAPGPDMHVFAIDPDGQNLTDLGFVDTCPTFSSLAVDADNLYVGSTCVQGDVGTGSRIVAVPKAGGAPLVLWSNAGGSLRDIAARDGVVYAATLDGVLAIPIDGGTITTLSAGIAGGVAVDETRVWFVTYSGLEWVPIGGGQPTVVTDSLSKAVRVVLAPDAAIVEAGDDAGLFLFPFDGSPSTTLVDAAGPPTYRDGWAYYVSGLTSVVARVCVP